MLNIMKSRWASKTFFVLIFTCLGVTGFNSVHADDTLRFRWLMGESDPDVTGIELCEMGSCPTKSAASSGETLVMTGVGTLVIKDNGRPKGINGGGTFAHRDKDGNLISAGEWKAKRLIMFDTYGPSSLDSVPPNFTAGRMLAEIKLKPKKKTGDPSAGSWSWAAVFRVTPEYQVRSKEFGYSWIMDRPSFWYSIPVRPCMWT